ncbi:predicted protein [Nematostella vectensis]|uniref:G-protein coupled receptors family 1 profile domain-containing protein n=1 Tax=Nematostella vectensis TaxID=45351 RepID=A7SD63_NEMVE|nr:chemerin-like receptor 1 [Nematostella vectensis]EDO38390.1 predicted protein [Nematostella vectensis]|eukprot:XP_001630453.1 predicted protein [Nematostella vectensis]
MYHLQVKNSSIQGGSRKECSFQFANGVAVISVNALFAFLGIIGNALALVTLWKTPRFRASVSAMCVGAVAATDLMTSLFVQPSLAIFIGIQVNGKCGDNLWPVLKFSGFYSCCASVVILCAMSVERCLAICCPIWHKRKITVKVVKVVMIIIFIAALFPAAPQTLELPPSHFTSGMVISGICLVFIVIISSYLAIFFRVLKQSRTFSHLSDNQRRSFSKNKRLARTVALIIGAYFLCWCPLGYSVQVSKTDFFTISKIWPVTIGLFSSTLNPVIYFFRGSEFRKELKLHLAVCVGHCTKNNVAPQNITPYNQEHSNQNSSAFNIDS